MSSETENNKRIAKNTIYLYFRMLITLCVGLYTTRVVINALGIQDYGVYNVMGGIIGMLTYVNTLLSGGTSRFLTLEIGNGNKERQRLTFSISNTLCWIVVVLILFLGETIGFWFMDTQLNIDPDRMDAARWVYQCALISCCFSVIQTPYSAAVIAHERMSVYAYMSIFDVVMKLVTAFMLLFVGYDKLILYSLLTLSVNAMTVMVYVGYCFLNFQETTLQLKYDKSLFHEMLTFSGWNMLGAISGLLNNYGLNILLNIFFGTIVNAARGIALQVSGIIVQLYSNFEMASRPQIMKYYAQHNIEAMYNLICNTSRYSAMLLLCISIPVCFNIDGLLTLWLGHSPEYTSWFIRVILLQYLFYAIDTPVGMGIHAVGKMRLPNITSSMLYISVFPLTYLALKLGASPIASYIIYVIIAPVILLVDLWILNKYTDVKLKDFVVNVLYPMSKVLLIGILGSYLLYISFPVESVLGVLAKTTCSTMYVCAVVYACGLSESVRLKINKVVKTWINKRTIR